MTATADKNFQKLFNSARRAIEKAYAPYSKAKVGAALLTSDGKVYSGCNVENASYGATICAERTAILKAVSEGRKKIKAILVVTNQKEIWPPCGMCLQVMAEFCPGSCPVYLTDLKKNARKVRFGELMPAAFTKSQLKPG